MSNINCIIADDEKLSRDLVKTLLKNWPQIEIVAECKDGLSALNEIMKWQPDLIFLDIQMPDLDGFEMLEQLQLEKIPHIIIISAHDKYALKAFDNSAIDYLLKPLTKERFDQAIQKAINIRADTNENLLKMLNTILNDKKNRNSLKYLTRFLIRENKRLFFLKVEKVDWLEGAGDYVKIHQGDKTSLMNSSLTELENRLDPDHFIRIHRSTIVNIDFIKELHPHSNGEFIIVLKNNNSVKLSRSYKDRIKPFLERPL
jgi:two-component system LytT family response regulator